MKIPPFELERYFAQHEFTAPYLLCSSDCESISLKELLDFEPNSREAFEKLWLGYTESNGNPKLREVIASLYQTIQPNQILVHTGAGEPIFHFMNVTLTPQDHIIVHWPCYQSLFQVATSIGCEVTKWEADPNNHWELDPNFLKKTIRKNTKAVVLNCPHNPTGYLMSREKLNEVVKITDHYGVILFMDEVYKGLEYDPADTLPSACDLSENAVSLGVLSKAYGLAGLRIGWVTSKNRKILSEMAAFKDYVTICNSAPSEFLATLALRHGERLLSKNRAIIANNLKILDQFLENNSQIEWARPKAGCIAFPRLKEGNSENFCKDLLNKTGVLLAPGTKFGFDSGHFRIGYGRKSFPEALDRLTRLPRPAEQASQL